MAIRAVICAEIQEAQGAVKKFGAGAVKDGFQDKVKPMLSPRRMSRN